MRTLALLLLALLAVAGFAAATEDASASAAVDTASFQVETGLSAEQMAAAKDQGEVHEFQAEINRLMDIIINSLYSSRDIFIRELISNSADALDKVRFKALTDGQVLDADADLDIRVSVDPAARTLTITDKGIGMKKEELIRNLGVVAKSGTADFIEAVTKGSAEGGANSPLALIGQFGVGFYSVYLVADEVTVISKHEEEAKQWIWHSDADRTFTVTEDPRGVTMARGTSVVLHLKEDASEFLELDNLTKLIQRHSGFINFPIRLLTVETVTREEPVEETEEEVVADEDKEKTEGDDEDDLEVQDDDAEDQADAKPKTRTVKEEVKEWKVLNAAKALWTRSPEDITEEEYNEFYTALTKDSVAPLAHTHFTAEGEISFRGLLYIPSKADPGFYDKLYEKSNALKLYVRRVLIADEFDNFLPRYLSFMRGVIDSDDLPLNVNRESLQQSRILKVMSKKITRKALELLRKLAEKGQEAANDENENEDNNEDQAEKTVSNDYDKFWAEFGKSIKLGVLEDRSNKNKLAKLLRFETSRSGPEGTLRSLEDYVEDMPEGQKNIFYITGESLEQVKQSPFLEALNRKGYEVLYLVDPLDEYVTQTITEFDGVNLMSVTKEGFKLGSEDEGYEAKLKEKYEPLTKWLGKVYGDKVAKVVVSQRLETTPCVLVTGQYGWSANMERIMKAQTFSDAHKQQYMFSRRTMEINPRHPLVRALYEKVAVNDEGDAQEVKDLAMLMHDAALVNSGFGIGADAKDFAGRIFRVVGSGLDVAGQDELLPADEFEIDAEDEEAGADATEADVDMDEDATETGEAEVEATVAAQEAEEAAAEEDHGDHEDL